jgi:hypothetical protein
MNTAKGSFFAAQSSNQSINQSINQTAKDVPEMRGGQYDPSKKLK